MAEVHLTFEHHQLILESYYWKFENVCVWSAVRIIFTHATRHTTSIPYHCSSVLQSTVGLRFIM